MTDSRDILFLDHAGVLGGAELSLHDIVKHFGDRGRTILLSDGPFREMLEQSGVAVEVVEAPASMAGAKREAGLAEALRSSVGLGGLVRRLLPHARRSRVLYANSQKAFVIAWVLGHLARRPIVWHLRDVLSPEHFSRLNRVLTTRLARRGRIHVIANSTATRDAFIEAGGPADRIVTIPNGIDPRPHDAVSDAKGHALRESLGLRPADFVVGSFSRLAPWKGQHVLIEAVARCANAHALLVGDALFGETEYRDDLMKRVNELSVGDRVHHLGFRDDVPTLMKACDAITHTSVAPEPFGRVIVEGMFARRPVIATRGGGASEIIANDKQGILVPPGDAPALSAAMNRLHADPYLVERLAAAGRARAEAAFSVETLVRQVDRYIEDVFYEGGRRNPQRKSDPIKNEPSLHA